MTGFFREICSLWSSNHQIMCDSKRLHCTTAVEKKENQSMRCSDFFSPNGIGGFRPYLWNVEDTDTYTFCGSDLPIHCSNRLPCFRTGYPNRHRTFHRTSPSGGGGIDSGTRLPTGLSDKHRSPNKAAAEGRPDKAALWQTHWAASRACTAARLPRAERWSSDDPGWATWPRPAPFLL